MINIPMGVNSLIGFTLLIGYLSRAFQVSMRCCLLSCASFPCDEELVPLGFDDRPVLTRDAHRPTQLARVVLPHHVPQMLRLRRIRSRAIQQQARTSGGLVDEHILMRIRAGRQRRKQKTISEGRPLLEGEYEGDEALPYVHSEIGRAS